MSSNLLGIKNRCFRGLPLTSLLATQRKNRVAYDPQSHKRMPSQKKFPPPDKTRHFFPPRDYIINKTTYGYRSGNLHRHSIPDKFCNGFFYPIHHFQNRARQAQGAKA